MAQFERFEGDIDWDNIQFENLNIQTVKVEYQDLEVGELFLRNETINREEKISFVTLYSNLPPLSRNNVDVIEDVDKVNKILKIVDEKNRLILYESDE